MAAEGLGVVAKLASGKFNAHLIFVTNAKTVSMEKQSEYSEPENETFWWKIVHFWLDIFSLNF